MLKQKLMAKDQEVLQLLKRVHDLESRFSKVEGFKTWHESVESMPKAKRRMTEYMVNKSQYSHVY